MFGITSTLFTGLVALGVLSGDGKPARSSTFAEDRLAPNYVAPAPAVADQAKVEKKRKRRDPPNPIRNNKQPDGSRIGGAGRIK